MGVEIERKFLVQADDWRKGATPVLCRQGYMPSGPGLTMRVRVMGDQGFLTIKGKTQGISRTEYEYPIPRADADELLDQFCRGAIVEKYRSAIHHAGRKWEVDEFLGANKGLIMAEIELSSPDQHVDLPPWVGAEVSHDPRYRNASLARKPYSTW